MPLKSSIDTGRYTADYLQCGNLSYPVRCGIYIYLNRIENKSE